MDALQPGVDVNVAVGANNVQLETLKQ